MKTDKCPICLEKESNFGNFCICYNCGSSICEICKKECFKRHKLECSICRKTFLIDPFYKYFLLLRLINREGFPGVYSKYELGILYFEINEDEYIDKAIQFLEESKSLGYPKIYYALFNLYLRKISKIEKSEKLVKQMYLNLCKSLKVPGTFLCLSEVYKYGWGVKQNFRYAKILQKISSKIEKGCIGCDNRTGERIYCYCRV